MKTLSPKHLAARNDTKGIPLPIYVDSINTRLQRNASKDKLGASKRRAAGPKSSLWQCTKVLQLNLVQTVSSRNCEVHARRPHAARQGCGSQSVLSLRRAPYEELRGSWYQCPAVHA